MKYLLLLPGLILAVFTGSAQTKNFIDRPFIEVIGAVDTLLTPDEIYIKILLSEKDSKDKETLEALEIKMVEVLKSLGIDTEKDLTASDLASNFKDYFLKRTDILKAKEYVLKVGDATLATNVIIDLEDAGISNTNIDRVNHSGVEHIKMSMRSQASKNAREKALAFVEPLGQQIGDAIFISETNTAALTDQLSGRVPGIMIRGVSAQGIEKKKALPAIEFEKIKVEVSVEMKFELKGAGSPE